MQVLMQVLMQLANSFRKMGGISGISKDLGGI
jgi:hypothetical protein